MNGPMKMPILVTPPNVDSARARKMTGTASVRNFCRARLKTLADIPTNVMEAASNQRPCSSCGANAAAPSAMAPKAPAPTIDHRSPNFSVMIEAGILKIHEPSPISVTINAETATEAPSSRAESAMTGRTAPSPIQNSRAGPKAGSATLRRLKFVSAWVVVIPFILGPGEAAP